MIIILTTHKELEKFMAAIDDLNNNIAALTTAVAAAIPDINPLPGTGATEAQVATAAANVAAQTALINAAIAPPYPTQTLPPTP